MSGPPSLKQVPIRQSLVNAEDKMEIVYGKVREILSESDGRMSGFVIDGGLEVHFPKDKAKQVAAVISLGSRLEICGSPYRGPSGDPRLDAQFIANLDFDRSVNLQDSPPPQKPEMVSPCSPETTEAASLAPPQSEKSNDSQNSAATKSATKPPAEHARQTAILSANLTSRAPLKEATGSVDGRARADEDEAVRSIELAYAGLHRAQALLAYIKIVDLQIPDVSELFGESRHTYQQALSSYQKQDYAVASEFAAASGELSRSVELVASRTLREDSNYPTLVPYPPGNHAGVTGSAETEEILTRVGKLLARIHWLLQNGTLPSQDRDQVQRIASWSDTFYTRGRRSYRTGAVVEGSYFINAAEAIAQSAEHVCKQDYIAHASATN